MKDEKVAAPKDENKKLDEQTSEEQAPKQTTPKKHKHRLVLLVSLSVLFILCIPLFIAGWLGFVPGLSNILGARTPVDLGVEWSEADYQSYLEKTGASFVDFSEAPVQPNNPDKKTVFADPKTVSNQTFTQEELSAAINSVGWAWMPISNAQIRLSDNIVEISGNMELENIENFVRFIGGVGYDDSSVNTAADWGRRLVSGAPIYLKASASVANDTLDFALQEVRIGRFSVPFDVASTVVSTGSSNSINNTKNFEAESVSFQEGEMLFSGTYPTTVYVLR